MNGMPQLDRMTRAEKLVVMEAIWTDLSADAVAVESPNWHENALRETEADLTAGREQILDWADAKRKIRQNSG